MLQATAADLKQTENLPLELPETAYKTDAGFLCALVRGNLDFAAGVVHACAVRACAVSKDASRSPCCVLLDEAWAAYGPELAAACLRRLAAPRVALSETRLGKKLAKTLCAHGVSVQQIVMVNQCPLADDIAGFFARHGISVPDDVLAEYLGRYSARECMRKFVKCMSRLKHTGAQAVQIAASLQDMHGGKVMHPSSLPSFGLPANPVPAEVLSEIALCVVVGCGCDRDGWPLRDD